MSGIIVKKEQVNTGRGFGEAVEYVPCWVKDADGTFVSALFTKRQIDTGITRAALQPEDTKSRPPFVVRLLARWL